MFSKNAIDRGFVGLARLLAALVLLSAGGCYIPGLIEPTEATDPPEGAITGETETYYGKFMAYQVANSKLGTLEGDAIDYIVGEDVYFPDSEKDNSADYNIYNNGNEDALTFHYKDTFIDRYAASGRPEALILKTFNPVRNRRIPSLTMFYTHPRNNFTNFNQTIEGDAFIDNAGDTPATAAPASTGTGFIGNFAYAGDIDVFAVDVTAPAVLAIKGRYSQLYVNSSRHATEIRHRLQLRLLDPSGAELYRSNHGLDFWKNADPNLTYIIQTSGTYYLEVTDINRPLETSNGQDYYQIILDASNDPLVGKIMKGEIQPARSGNRHLAGGATFEPDDLKTKVDDIWPDCDGIPGSGDEGDAGIYEMCGSITEYGANDGTMQYQEVDNKTAVDDGEYFVGKPTNIPAFFDSEATIIRTPKDHNSSTPDSLSMFIAYNSGIYWLESLDGETGLNWDLSHVFADEPAVSPLSRRGGGQADTPVITSGILGFCDTAPAAGDAWGAPELQEYAEIYGTTTTLNGTMVNSPTGYPDTVAVTFGGNNYLDSQALVDELDGNVITSGPDGIINTFFAPSYVAYSMLPSPVAPPHPVIQPGNTLATYGMNGPGTPDNPPIYDSGAGDYVFPLDDPAYGGNDQRAFLLGDDEWNPAIFRGDTITPAAYWRKQRCHFYSIGSDFDRCAYGVPEDENGAEPVVITTGKDSHLDTIEKLLKSFRGDDVICHEGNTVGICPGPDGSFGWKDIYIPLKGDDHLALVYDPTTPDPADLIVGISSGLNGNFETTVIYGYTLVDYENFKMYIGGDIDTLDIDGNPAVCPGPMDLEIDYYNSSFVRITGTRRLMTIWPMYSTSNTKVLIEGLPWSVLMLKKDIYNTFDDEFCSIDGGIALCPGLNGVFQSYPLSERVEVDEDDDLFVLYERVKDRMGKDCYSLQAEIYKDSFDEKDKVRFVFYHDLGIRMDDRVRWNAELGWHVSAGRNGINQSCTLASDKREIPMWEGLAGRPIITPGADGVFQTYPLKDEEFKWADNVKKISTGADGIANSFVRGDDRLEIFMGTGKPDHPCVRSGDGVADTQAQNYNYGSGTPIWTNDRQIYELGQRTGFDAFEVFGPKAVTVDDKIYLYYSALGWEEYPEQFRSSAGALGDVGECRRPGLDMFWGKRDPNYSLEPDEYILINYDLMFIKDQFRYLLDNNESVAIAPRIGLAVSSIKRLRKDPTDWDIRPKPVLDLGQQCAGTMSFPISLPLDLPGLAPDSNFYGAFSPEIEQTETIDGERIFLMFFTGLTQGEGSDVPVAPKATVGLARSFDGVRWEMLRDFKTVISSSTFDVTSLIGAQDTQYATPTIYPSGEDEYGFKMYGMFFNQFVSSLAGNQGYLSLDMDFRSKDHIGWALRKGQSYMSSFCSLSADTYASDQDRGRRILQVVILAIPVGLAGIFGLSRRRRKS